MVELAARRSWAKKRPRFESTAGGRLTMKAGVLVELDFFFHQAAGKAFDHAIALGRYFPGLFVEYYGF